MKGMKWLVLLATAMITGCAQSPPEQQTINDAASALGGRDKILAVKTLILEGGGTNGNLGQDVTPEATSQTFTLTDYKRVVDVAAPRVRVEQTRTHAELYVLSRPAGTEASIWHRWRRGLQHRS